MFVNLLPINLSVIASNYLRVSVRRAVISQVYHNKHSAAQYHHIRGADKSLARTRRKQTTPTKHARRLTCFLSASVTRKDLQFGT